MNDENEIEIIIKELEMIESGKCPYFNPINEDETCSPLKRRYYELIYNSEVSEK